MKKSYSEITPYIKELAKMSCENNRIEPQMYQEHNVKRGLRDLDGNGVVTGLTEISNIKAKGKTADGEIIPCEGELYYRGFNVRDLVAGFKSDDRFGFEETIYLLLFSELPTKEKLEKFKETLAEYRSLPPYFVIDMILKAPGDNMMNMLSRCVLALYTYDENLMRIIEEESAAFFSGQKKAKEVADIIQSRVQIYVNETR